MGEPDPSLAWAATARGQVPDLVKRTVPVLVQTLDDEVGTRSSLQRVCADSGEAVGLVAAVLTALEGGGTEGAAARYRREEIKPRKRRRPNAVHVIVNSGALEEGTPYICLCTYCRRRMPSPHGSTRTRAALWRSGPTLTGRGRSSGQPTALPIRPVASSRGCGNLPSGKTALSPTREPRVGPPRTERRSPISPGASWGTWRTKRKRIEEPGMA